MRGARTALLHATGALLLCGALSACNPQSYVGVGGVYSFAMDENVAPLIEGDEDALYFIEDRIELPIIPPTRSELGTLQAIASPPFPRLPWVLEDDLPLQVDWALTNLTDEPVTVTLTLNGINEFNEYMPSFTVEDDEVVAGYSQWEKKMELEPFQTVNGTIREAEMHEVAVDLATVVNGAPNANEIVYFENQSDHDPRSKPYIPKTIPGLVGFRLGLQTNAPVRVVAEATVRVWDREGKLADPDDDKVWDLPMPVVFTPTEAEAP